MNTFMRKTVGKTALLAGITTACVLLSAAVPAQQTSQEQALRELNIMRNIFDAAMEDRKNRQFRINGPDALYLAGQGMVFTFNMSNGNFFTVPNINIYNSGDFDFDFDYDEENDSNSNTDANPTTLAYVREQQEKMQEFQEQMRAQQEAMQDKQEDMRDLQREMRDLQREQRNQADVDEAQLDRLNDQMEALGKEMAAIGKSINDQQQNYRKEQNAVAETLFAQQTDLIFSTLCSYGNTLRSLGNGEHVNLVMQNHNNGESRIYVIDYAKLASCSSGDSLRQGAMSYITSNR